MQTYDEKGRLTPEARKALAPIASEDRIRKLMEDMMEAGFTLREAELFIFQDIAIAASLICLGWGTQEHHKREAERILTERAEAAEQAAAETT